MHYVISHYDSLVNEVVYMCNAHFQAPVQRDEGAAEFWEVPRTTYRTDSSRRSSDVMNIALDYGPIENRVQLSRDHS
jgi:hypothetical protein